MLRTPSSEWLKLGSQGELIHPVVIGPGCQVMATNLPKRSPQGGPPHQLPALLDSRTA